MITRHDVEDCETFLLERGEAPNEQNANQVDAVMTKYDLSLNRAKGLIVATRLMVKQRGVRLGVRA